VLTEFYRVFLYFLGEIQGHPSHGRTVVGRRRIDDRRRRRRREGAVGVQRGRGVGVVGAFGGRGVAGVGRRGEERGGRGAGVAGRRRRSRAVRRRRRAVGGLQGTRRRRFRVDDQRLQGDVVPTSVSRKQFLFHFFFNFIFSFLFFFQLLSVQPEFVFMQQKYRMDQIELECNETWVNLFALGF